MTKASVSQLFSGIVFLLSARLAAPGQLSPDAPIGVSAGLARMFGGVTGFAARADAQVLDARQQEILRAPMSFALLDGKMRVELDFTAVKGKAVPPGAMAALKSAGLDRTLTIIRPDKKMSYLVFTGVRSYVATKLSTPEVEATQKNARLQITALGQETVDGHLCAKRKAVLKNSKGAGLMEATTWNAAELKDFPIQIAVPGKDNTTILRFSQIQIGRPPPAQFEPPSGYTKYHSAETLMLNASMKQRAAPAADVSQKPKSADNKNATVRK